jgi:hypothetical protein
MNITDEAVTAAAEMLPRGGWSPHFRRMVARSVLDAALPFIEERDTE